MIVATFGTFVDGVSLKASELNSLLVSTTFTPVIRQSSSLTVTDAFGRYQKVSNTVLCQAFFQVFANGVANNRIEFDLPVTAATNSVRVIGSGYIFDAGSTNVLRVAVVRFSTTKAAFLGGLSNSLTNYLGLSAATPTITLEAGDFFGFTIQYEAA